MRFLLLAVLLASASYGCQGNISQYVPAVVGDDGGLINVTVSLAPGDGHAYVTVYPLIGMSTQESIQQAVDYAYSLSGKEQGCDVLFRFGEDYGASYIDGPSAGAALTTMTYALLEGKSMREDTIVTGTVDRLGNVGPVGGTYEKAKGAADMGAEYFIMPPGNFYEVLLLRNIEDEEGITILEAKKVEDVIGFMTENRSIEQTPLDARKRDIPELSRYDAPVLAPFVPVARRMIAIEREVLASIIATDDETYEIKGFFENEVQRQESILDDGYVFSAANDAFLSYIDISTIAVMAKGKADLPRKKGELGICLTGISRPNKTDVNYEWMVGSDLREAWAYDRYDMIDATEELLTDEEFIAYNELMYGQAWCNVAKELIAASPDGGSPIDESGWKRLAESKLAEARLMGTTAEDTRNRLMIAEQSYNDGKYGAAIFDAVYVIEMEQSDMDILDGMVTEDVVESLLDEDMESLWGNVYKSHAAFQYEMNETDAAYVTLRFAKGLDLAVADMDAMLEREVVVRQPEDEEMDLPLLAAVAISLFLFIIVIVLIRRVYGSESKGYRKAYRAKQKKG